ncbi:MAG: YezD family protein [Verrucomicrobia bacterium]|nr:YezD family protein [Verrucomicrobiota bacterium]
MPHEQQNDWLELVREKVRTLHFGVVQIVVHDSKVTQIERTERVRLNGAAPSGEARLARSPGDFTQRYERNNNRERDNLE